VTTSHSVRSWTARTVAGVVYHDDIQQLTEKESEDVPGGPRYIKAYQSVLKTYFDGLSDEKLAECENRARNWNSEGTPAEIQRQ
jgi:hypothetical protein